jgi:hypothetical protein
MKKQTAKKTVTSTLVHWVEPVRTIPCPQHGFPLELKEQDGKLIAVCHCDVKPNKHAGQTVYERIIDQKEK